MRIFYILQKMISQKRNVFLLGFLISLIFSNTTIAQLDTEFWFAPPELTESTNPGTGGPRDRPIQLVVSTLEKAAKVTIITPADLTFTPIVLNMPANTTQIVNLTPFIDRLESKPHNTILKTGLYIKSTQSISAYYEIKSSNNTDIFALKGANSLGKLFYTPFQTHWDNALSLSEALYAPTTYASFDIVATDDTTDVTITPGKDIIGHPKGIPFSVRLNRGQVYSCRAIDRFGANHPVGSKIQSTKDVAVTIKDDMLQFAPPVPGADIAGDQLIPVDFLGKNYVLVKGGLLNNNDRCYILAIEDNTIIRVDGDAIPLDTLNEGEQFELRMTKDSYFLASNKNVCVWHISGIQDQVGGAIIPALNCTGTNRIGFTRTNASLFIVNVITKSTAINNFTLNGDPNLVPGSAFQPILGSNGWMFARITFSTSQIPAGTTLLLKNSGDELFHVGVTNYAAGVGSNYGYFSNFSRLNLGTTKNLCTGDTAILDAGPAKTFYQWNTGANTRTLETQIPGKYWVNTLSGTQCPKSDTVVVNFYNPTFTLGSDDTICIGGSRRIIPSGVFTYKWQDGTTSPTYLAQAAGKYYADVKDFQGCPASDTILIAESPRPNVPVASLGDTVCEGGQVNLSMGIVANARYGWADPDSNIISGRNIVVNTAIQKAGDYKAFVKIAGCESFFDTAFVGIVQSPPVALGKDSVLCNPGGGLTLDAGKHQPGNIYKWNNNSTDSTLNVTQTGIYFVEVKSQFGCFGYDTISVIFQDLPVQAVFTGLNTFCENQTASFGVVQAPNFEYVWSGPNGFSFTGNQVNLNIVKPSQAGTYTVTPKENGCSGTTSNRLIVINAAPQIELGKDSTSCTPFILNLDPTVNGKGLTYLWNDDSVDSTLATSLQGTYFVEVSNATCTSYDTIRLVFGEGPSSVTFTGNRNYCSNENVSFGVIPKIGETYTWTGPNGFNFVGETISFPKVQLAQAGQYSVTPSLPGCPGKTFLSNLIVRPSPIADLGKDTSFCPGIGIVLDPTPNGGEDVFYKWSNSLADSSILVTQEGQYSVIATLGLCTSKDTIQITKASAPVKPTFNGILSYCPGQDASFGVNQIPNVTYNWAGPNAYSSNNARISLPSIQNNQGGFYVVVPFLGRCPGPKDSVEIVLKAAPVLKFGDDTTICNLQPIVLDPINNGKGLTYLWSTLSTDSSISVTIPGKYSVVVSNGICSSKDSVVIKEGEAPAQPTVTGLLTYCEGQNLSLKVDSVSNVNYSWTGPNGFVSSGANISIGNVTVLNAGQYTIIPNLKGCQGTARSINILVGLKPNIELGADDTICNGSTIKLDPIANSEGFTFLWSDNSSDTLLTASTTGNYKVTVSNGSCSAVDSVNLIFSSPANTLVIGGVTTVCQGSQTILSVSAQTGVVVSWSGPDGFTANGSSIILNNIQSNQAGSYIANTSQNACPGTGDTTTIGLIFGPPIELGADRNICNGGSATLDPTFNGAGLTYDWSTGSTDSVITATTSGKYIVTVSGSGVCKSKDSVSVFLGNTPGPPTLAGTNNYCIGTNALFGVVAQSGVTYAWTGPNGFVSTEDTIKITNIGSIDAGQYKVTPSIGICKGAETIITVSVGPGPVIDLGKDTVICGNTPFVLDPVKGLSGYQYLWNGGNTDTLFVTNQSGIYTVDVSYLGCTKSDTISLTFKGLPLPVTIEGTTSNCAGDTLTLSLQGTQSGVVYDWAGPAGFTDAGSVIKILNINVLQSGIYNVTPKLDGCEGIETSIPININPKPIATLGTDLQSCLSVTFNLDPNPSSAGLTFVWNTGSTDTSIIVNQTGLYSVIVTNGSNCKARDTIKVTLNAIPVSLTFTGDTIICVGESASFGVQNQSEVTNSWTGPGGFNFSGDLISIPSVQTSSSGAYIVQPVGTGGCLGEKDSVFLKVSDKPSVSIGQDQTLCGNGPITLKAISTAGNSYLWNTGSIADSLVVAGSNTYSVIATNAGECSAYDTVVITFKPQPQPIEILQGASQSICENRLVTFEVVDQQGVTFSWTGPQIVIPVGNEVNFIANLQNSGTYTVASDLNGCPGESKSITLNVKPSPTVSVSVDEKVCYGLKKLATATLSEGASIFWSDNSSEPTGNFGVGSHWAQAILNGCSVRDSFEIGNSGPNAAFKTAPDSAAPVYELVQFIDNSTAGESPLASWEWKLGQSQIRTERYTSYSYNVEGDYGIQLIVKDQAGCADTLIKKLSITPPNSWFVPSLFTPNGDGENDTFVIIKLQDFPDTQVSIYNRWGGEEFSSNNYQNDFDGKDLVEGIYFYTVKRKDGKEFRGNVYLKR